VRLKSCGVLLKQRRHVLRVTSLRVIHQRRQMKAGAIHTHYREAFPLPETPVGLDPTSAFDVPYADETPEFQLSPEVEALLAKVNTRVAGQSDAARLSEIIDDPLLNDPRAEAILEQEIFYYLLEQIEFDERSQRSWLMLDDGKGNSATSMEVEVDNLLIKADQAFGWLSDQVGSQHKFPAYSVFIESLGKGEFIPESEPDESSQPVLKTILIWVLIFASVTGFGSGVRLSGLHPRTPNINSSAITLRFSAERPSLTLSQPFTHRTIIYLMRRRRLAWHITSKTFCQQECGAASWLCLS